MPSLPAARELPPGAERHEPRSAAPAEASSLADEIRNAALRLGFCRVGFCGVDRFDQAGRALADWLSRGRNGEMSYLAGPGRDDPTRLLAQAQTLIVVALPHSPGPDASAPRAGEPIPLRGRVARYARGNDYHHVLKARLRALARACADLSGRSVIARPCVDSAPLLEREAARRAGIAFTGKSTMSILPGFGTYALLGELLIDLELPPASPLSDQCGRCTACLDACPSGAFVDARTLDARRCISYLTIELRGAIPRPLRPAIGRWVFGCDVCQEVCPFNHSRKPRPEDDELSPRAALTDPELVQLLEMGASAYRRLVRGSALERTSQRRLQRNAAVALGNSGSPAAVAPLVAALGNNPSPVVRGHVAWALGALGTAGARRALLEARDRETDASVLEEIAAALGELS